MEDNAFPAGKYFLGDPCYALSNTLYDEEWGKMAGYRSGKIKTSRGDFIVYRTAYGDGLYSDEYDGYYPVDSGTIALIPWSLCDKLVDEAYIQRSGRVLMMDEGGTYDCFDGVFELHSGDIDLSIDTTADDV